MLSIGEIAHSTGVSRRMLRHWESEGLLTPAVVDPVTGYRHFRDSQLGRVRAIAELRALGFGLAEIGRLLDPQIEQPTLESLLARQVDVLEREISEASTRLVHVQRRLDTIRSKTVEIIMNLSLTTLPRLELQGLRTTVHDETEIGQAVSDLCRRLPQADGDFVLLYDGTHDDRITVSAGTVARAESEAVPAELEPIVAPEIPAGVAVAFDERPASIADAWVLIETELEKQGLTSFGLYRQVDGPTGVVLQAPVRERR